MFGWSASFFLPEMNATKFVAELTDRYVKILKGTIWLIFNAIEVLVFVVNLPCH